MKFNCGLTRKEKILAKEQWHRWFAWKPIRFTIGDNRRTCAWLEVVERKGAYVWRWYWDYRAI